MTDFYSSPRHDRLYRHHRPYDILDRASLPTASTVLTCIVLLLASAFYLLRRLNIIPPDATRRLLWEVFVYLTPSSLVLALDKQGQADLAADNADQGTFAMSRTLGAKSEAMYRILGSDNYGLLAKIQPSKGLAGFGSSSKPSQRLPGLGNWDNSCYQNSIIQGLASLPSVAKFLAQAYGSSSNAGGLSTRCALKDTIEQLNSAKNYGRRMWTPLALKSMSSWQQQDAQEYYSKVVDALEKEAIKSFQGTAKNAGLSKLKDVESFRQRRNPNEKSEGDAVGEKQNIFDKLLEETAQACLRNPLEGHLAQRVGCLKCGFVEGISIIPFNCLTLPLDRGWEFPIEDCLDEYTTLEPIQGVECANCTLLQQKQQIQRFMDRQQAQMRNESEPSQRLASLYASAQTRLDAINEALSASDFSEATLREKCGIPSKLRVSTTKSRQAVIARAPKSLVLHVNRSIFDELSGTMSKNLASVRFPKRLDLTPWCLGPPCGGSALETWETDPAKSMLAEDAFSDALPRSSGPERDAPAPRGAASTYVLRAVVTHYGRHENGHYIAYRRDPSAVSAQDDGNGEDGEDNDDDGAADWWRLSDEDVARVDEAHVLAQGGVFMLFYERLDEARPPAAAACGDVADAETAATDGGATAVGKSHEGDGLESEIAGASTAASDDAGVEADVVRSFLLAERSASAMMEDPVLEPRLTERAAERDGSDAAQPVVPPMRTASSSGGSVKGISVAGLGVEMVEAN